MTIRDAKDTDDLDELIDKEKKISSIRKNTNNNKQKEQISLDVLNYVNTKGKITRVKNAGDNIGLEISYNNTKFCKKIKIPDSNVKNKDDYIIFDLLEYYNIKDGQFINLEGKEVYIIESKESENKIGYELSIPTNINNISNKIFSILQSCRKKGLIDLYNIQPQNKTKIKINPVSLFPILISIIILFGSLSFIFDTSKSIINSSSSMYAISLLSDMLMAVSLIGGFYLAVLTFFLILHIIDKFYTVYIYNPIQKYWPVN